MIAMNSTVAPRAANRSKFAVQVIGVVAAFCMATGCVTNDNGSPTNQTTGTILGAALGGTVGGLAFGSAGGVVGGALVGALAGNLVGRAADHRLRDACRTESEPTRRQHLPADRTDGDKKWPDDAGNHDVLPGHWVQRTQAGLRLIGAPQGLMAAGLHIASASVDAWGDCSRASVVGICWSNE